MPASTPILSIGVPVFNGEPYITQSLASILGQTFTNFEVIVFDNASTDGTADICRSHEARDKRIRYSRNSTNIGSLSNFRRVLDLATGEYFMWAACDDYWSPGYVETLLACLKQYPDAVLAAGRVHFVDPSGSERTDILPDDPPAPGIRPDGRREACVPARLVDISGCTATMVPAHTWPTPRFDQTAGTGLPRCGRGTEFASVFA